MMSWTCVEFPIKNRRLRSSALVWAIASWLTRKSKLTNGRMLLRNSPSIEKTMPTWRLSLSNAQLVHPQQPTHWSKSRSERERYLIPLNSSLNLPTPCHHTATPQATTSNNLQTLLWLFTQAPWLFLRQAPLGLWLPTSQPSIWATVYPRHQRTLVGLLHSLRRTRLVCCRSHRSPRSHRFCPNRQQNWERRCPHPPLPVTRPPCAVDRIPVLTTNWRLKETKMIQVRHFENDVYNKINMLKCFLRTGGFTFFASCIQILKILS